MENNEVQQEEQQEQVEAVKQDSTNYADKYNEASKEVEKLKKQNSDFFNEIKKYKSHEKEKVEQTGDFEKLLKAEREEKETLMNEYNEFKHQYKSEKINGQAMRLANEIALNSESASLLSHFIKENLLKLADENGNLSDEIVQSVKKEVKNNKAYAPLVAGSKSSGSGAPGAGNGVAGVKEINYADYQKLDANQKLEFSRQIQTGKAKLI